jgi:hypothetical protein
LGKTGHLGSLPVIYLPGFIQPEPDSLTQLCRKNEIKWDIDDSILSNKFILNELLKIMDIAVLFTTFIVSLILLPSALEGNFYSSSRINFLLIILGLLFRNPEAAGTGILANGSQNQVMKWKNVKKVTFYPRSSTTVLSGRHGIKSIVSCGR